jgi:hypothetical protein
MHQHDAGCTHAAAPQPVYAAQPQPVYVAPPQSRAYRFFAALWTRPAWLAPLALLACVAATFTYVLANDPTDARRDPLGPCAFKLATGWDCPGCGGTRMVWYLLHGDLGEAARHHAVALIAVPVVVYIFASWASKRLFTNGLPTLSVPGKVWGAYLAGWLVFSVVRNLPWEPFNYLYVV